MSCLNPVVLKSGIVVPCGMCDLCRSDQRTQWSIRLAIHASYCDRMPLFICLTYDNNNMPLLDDEGLLFRYDWSSMQTLDYLSQSFRPTLWRADVSAFLKAYKRKYKLTNDQFTYFGCGEYGDTFGRPHYHLLFFGDDELYDLYFKDSELAVKRLQDVWQKGFVSIGVAQWSGIHYVTKYILKEDLNEIENLGIVPPFLVASKGLGNSFFDSDLAREWKKRVQWLAYNAEDVFKDCPDFDCDNILSIDSALDYLRPYMPSWKLPVDDGRFVILPRVLRKRLIGTFEHFKDNPLWLYQHLQLLRRSLIYYRDNGQYDQEHEIESWKPNLMNRILKIRQRLAKRKHDNIYKRSKL